jgi:hypothetical protein
MREIRPSGSEGGARFNPLLLPYRPPPPHTACGNNEIVKSHTPRGPETASDPRETTYNSSLIPARSWSLHRQWQLRGGPRTHDAGGKVYH